MTFIIFGNSSCIIFAVVRSTLLLLHFHLHSLFFRSYLVSLQYFDDFCSYAALVHVSFLLLCAVLRCFWAFICILCAFVISLCAHSILMIFFISSNNSCSIFALCVVLCWFCTCVCAWFGANFFLKSTNISLCAMSRLDLVTFWFSVGCRCAIGIVTKWRDFPPCDVTFLHLAFPLGDVTFLRVMWLKPGASMYIFFESCV